MIRQTLFLIILSFLLVACGPSRARMPADNILPSGANGGVSKVGNPYKVSGKWYYPKKEHAYDDVGIASWYGKQFHGKPTANGETYNMNALTAAHKTLPLPTNVKVTNLQNGRSIIVRVNDRGPFVGDRLIDLSRRAAQILGFTNQGTTKVRVQALNGKGEVVKIRKELTKNTPITARQNTVPQKVEQTNTGALIVQAGSFREKDNAHSRIRELANAGIKANITQALVNGVTYFRVVIGNFSNRGGAENVLDRVQARGFYDARIITN